MNKETKQLVEENNCLELFKEVNKEAKKNDLHLVVYKDYDAEHVAWEFFSIEARTPLDEPEIWVANICLYDGLEEMKKKLKEYTK